MTDSELEQQKAKAQQFSINMFVAIAPVVTTHFLAMVDRDHKAKEVELRQDASKTPEDISKALSEFDLMITQNAHMLVRSHTAFIVGGCTADMFPQIYPKVEEKAPESINLEVVKDPEPIVVGVAGIESEASVLG